MRRIEIPASEYHPIYESEGSQWRDEYLSGYQDVSISQVLQQVGLYWGLVSQVLQE